MASSEDSNSKLPQVSAPSMDPMHRGKYVCTKEKRRTEFISDYVPPPKLRAPAKRLKLGHSSHRNISVPQAVEPSLQKNDRADQLRSEKEKIDEIVKSGCFFQHTQNEGEACLISPRGSFVGFSRPILPPQEGEGKGRGKSTLIDESLGNQGASSARGKGKGLEGMGGHGTEKGEKHGEPLVTFSDKLGNYLIPDAAAVKWGGKYYQDVRNAIVKYVHYLPAATIHEKRRVLQGNANGKEKGDVTKCHPRPDMCVWGWMKEKRECVNTEKMLGTIPGIGVGSKFMSRCLLAIVGLHSAPRRGIDFHRFAEYDCTLALAIVNAGDEYLDEDAGHTLVYMGEGERKHNKQVGPQALAGGNLALKNSFEKKTPVRVIRGEKARRVSYSYDGLYTVEACYTSVVDGHEVWKFKLVRMVGQGADPKRIRSLPRPVNLKEQNPVTVSSVKKGVSVGDHKFKAKGPVMGTHTVKMLKNL